MNRKLSAAWAALAAAAMLSGCSLLPSRDRITGEVFAPSEVEIKPVPKEPLRANYPASQRGLQVGGSVLVSFVVDERGRVIDALAVPDKKHPPPDPAFVDSALAAVDQWEFTAGTNNGVPVKVEWQVLIEFKPSGP